LSLPTCVMVYVGDFWPQSDLGSLSDQTMQIYD